MGSLAQIRNAAACIILLLPVFAFHAFAQEMQKKAPRSAGQGVSDSASAKRVTFLKAIVVDDRFSALRREANSQSEVIRRLRLGHAVFIIRGSGNNAGRFCRIAATRRTRGWIHESALVVHGRAGEDQRIMKLIEGNGDTFDRIALCRILIEHFPKSRLAPRALLLIGEEANRAAETLSQRSRKRLAEAGREEANASLREFYLNDAGLDRYSKLRVVFDFNGSTAEYIYDGKAYREIIRRFPDGEEAKLALKQLERGRQKMAERK